MLKMLESVHKIDSHNNVGASVSPLENVIFSMHLHQSNRRLI